jgi:D-Tyr-tRNAtyr deacylase
LPHIVWFLITDIAPFCVTVSQFTLFGVLKGNKPDFHVAMPPQKAKPFYASLVEKFQKAYSTDAVKGIRSCLNLTFATAPSLLFFFFGLI